MVVAANMVVRRNASGESVSAQLSCSAGYRYVCPPARLPVMDLAGRRGTHMPAARGPAGLLSASETRSGLLGWYAAESEGGRAMHGSTRFPTDACAPSRMHQVALTCKYTG